MPRRLLLGSVAAATAAAALLLPTASAAAEPRPRPHPVLDRADSIFEGSRDPASYRLDASMALRDVFVARPTMDDIEKWRAARILARPSDRASDPYGDGYRVRSTRTCRGRVCVHYVASTRDAPPDKAWANTTLRVMSRVWRAEVHRMGYRPPPRDGKHGGDGRFDVYLKELGSQGLYGYCAPEYRVDGLRHVASGYCVLDDDFARKQYGVKPMVSLRVTAAHEFFHAIQFGYDFKEDPWLLESTAAWMEEQVADGANDNRRYLPYGQVAKPGTSLDRFDPGGFNQYGNWVFWEYLTQRYGADVVRAVWRRAAAYDGAPDRHSVTALRRTLTRYDGLPATFAAYATALTNPARTFPEGAAWPAAKTGTGRLGRKDRHAHLALRINHLASRSIAARPARKLRGDWRLEITIDGPARRTGPAAYLQVVGRNGVVRRRPIALNAEGVGRARTRFDAERVRRVTITLANTSTRQRRVFEVGARVLRRS